MNYTPDEYLLHDPKLEHAMSIIFSDSASGRIVSSGMQGYLLKIV